MSGLRSLAAMLLLALALVAVSSVSAMPPLQAHSIRPHRVVSHARWQPSASSSLRASSPARMASLSIVLAKDAAGAKAVKELLMRVSDPSHADYGRHASRETLRQMVAPAEHIRQAWDDWAQQLLLENSLVGGQVEWNDARDILRVRLPIRRMERLLGHEVHEYTHALLPAGENTCLRVSVSSTELLAEEAQVGGRAFPAALHSSISYVAGVTRFPPQVEAWANKPHTSREAFAMRQLPLSKPKATAAAAAPSASLQSPVRLSSAGFSALGVGEIDYHGEEQILYNTLMSSDHEETLLVLYVACSTPMSGGGNWTYPRRTGSGFACFGGSSQYVKTTVTLSRADGSDLKVETYTKQRMPLRVTSVGDAVLQMTVPLKADYIGWMMRVEYFWGLSSTSFVYPFLVRGIRRIHPLTVRQLYKVPEDLTDHVSADTFAKTKMAIAALGISDENPGYFRRSDLATFFDRNRVDPWTADARSGMLTYVDKSDPSDPNVEKYPDMETTLDISCAQGANNRSSLVVTHVSGRTDTPFEDLLNLALDDETVHVLSISYGVGENGLNGIDRLNTQLVQLGTRGISVMASSGDSGAFLSVPGCKEFAPSFPGSSPFVTSVGGSTLAVFDGPDADSCPSEVVCGLESTSSITAGGGFSAVQRSEPYQAEAVKSYLERAITGECRLPQNLPWSPEGRPFPDVALLSHSYEIEYQGSITVVDGTSASSPALAGIIGAYNAIRLEAGNSPLGFLNPVFYHAWNVTRNEPPGQRAFFDIVNGTNRCLAAGDGCCAEAFEACPGFDAVSGLGSPDFSVLGRFLTQGSWPVPLATNRSNYFFPTCSEVAFTAWPPSPVWESHPGPGKSNTLAIVVGVTFAVAAVGVLVCLGCWWWQNKRSAGAQRPQQQAVPAGAGVQMSPPAPHANWGPGRVLGSPGVTSPNNLEMPLSRGAQSDFERL